MEKDRRNFIVGDTSGENRYVCNRPRENIPLTVHTQSGARPYKCWSSVTLVHLRTIVFLQTGVNSVCILGD